MSIIIRCDIGQEIGLGHYYRCALLKKAFERNSVNASLALKNLDGHHSTLPYDLLIDGPYSEEVTKYHFQNQIIILDVFHHRNHHNEELEIYIKDLKANNNTLSFIEGIGDDFCPSAYYPYLDTLVSPYVYENIQKKHPHHLFGRDFLMMDSSRTLEHKEIRKISDRILLTFGGSDPWDQSIKVLDALKKDERSKLLEIMIVIGPFMSEQQVKRLQEQEYNFKKLVLIRSPENLKDCFVWADLAITNTGQTRYELAASGVPFFILPFDEEGYFKSTIFSELKAAHLQAYSEDVRMDMVFRLLEDYDQRLQMSMNGKTHFYNSNGIDNLAKHLIARG